MKTKSAGSLSLYAPPQKKQQQQQQKNNKQTNKRRNTEKEKRRLNLFSRIVYVRGVCRLSVAMTTCIAVPMVTSAKRPAANAARTELRNCRGSRRFLPKWGKGHSHDVDVVLLFSSLSLILPGLLKFEWEDHVHICFRVPRHVGRHTPTGDPDWFHWTRLSAVVI